MIWFSVVANRDKADKLKMYFAGKTDHLENVGGNKGRIQWQVFDVSNYDGIAIC